MILVLLNSRVYRKSCKRIVILFRNDIVKKALVSYRGK